MAKKKTAKKSKAKHPMPKNGRCPSGFHKGKTAKTKGKCVKSAKKRN